MSSVEGKRVNVPHDNNPIQFHVETVVHERLVGPAMREHRHEVNVPI